MSRQSWLFGSTDAQTQNRPSESAGVFLFLSVPSAWVEALIPLHQTPSQVPGRLNVPGRALVSEPAAERSEAPGGRGTCPRTRSYNSPETRPGYRRREVPCLAKGYKGKILGRYKNQCKSVTGNAAQHEARPSSHKRTHVRRQGNPTMNHARSWAGRGLGCQPCPHLSLRTDGLLLGRLRSEVKGLGFR